jgi:aminoglycoside phosphotransferase (APT) family kinase protein
VVDGDGRAGLLDFDTLAVGEAALDVANALVHFELRALQRLCLPEQARAATLEFLDAYGPGPEVRRRLDAYADATRLRLACVYAFRPLSSTLPALLLGSIGRSLLGKGSELADCDRRSRAARANTPGTG